MLTQTIYRIRQNEEAALNSRSASLLQGVLMEGIPPEYGELLHRSELKPYSQYLLTTTEQAEWHIQTLTEPALQLVDNARMRDLQSIYLKHREREYVVVGRTVQRTTMDELLQSTYFSQCPRRVTVRFVTPTSFKSNGAYTIFPTVHHIFQSLIAKFDAVGKNLEIGTPELLEDFEKNVTLAGYRLRSTTFGVEGVRIPSFIGEVTLWIQGPQPLVNLAHLLLRFGEYSGVGIKTAMGMGGIQLRTGQERKE